MFRFRRLLVMILTISVLVVSLIFNGHFTQQTIAHDHYDDCAVADALCRAYMGFATAYCNQWGWDTQGCEDAWARVVIACWEWMFDCGGG